jgi:hypothetical protein
MYFEWEDRKGHGIFKGYQESPGIMFIKKPDLGFTYAWVLLTDTTAQFVESHEEGFENKEMSQQQIDAILAYIENGEVHPPTLEPTAEEIKQWITTAVQSRLDTFAQTRNYDSILSACTYASSTVAQFASEGQQCVNVRDATWGKLYQIMQEVEAGTRPMPAGYADIESELPELAWA